MLHEDHYVCVIISKTKFVLLYIDDILLASNNLGFLLTIKEWLSSTFNMKDLGEVVSILGVKIQRGPRHC